MAGVGPRCKADVAGGFRSWLLRGKPPAGYTTNMSGNHQPVRVRKHDSAAGGKPTHTSDVRDFSPTHARVVPTDVLAVTQALLFTGGESLATMARRAGLSPTVVGRLAAAKRHVRLDRFLNAMGRLGLGLMGRRGGDRHWRVWILPSGNAVLPPGMTLNAVVMRAAERVPSITLLASQSGLSRSAVQRLRHGRLPPVWETIQQLMAAVDGEVVVLSGDGGVRRLELPTMVGGSGASGGRDKTKRRAKQVGTSPRRGRLIISKAEIFTLHEELNWSCARIAAVAGVSAERVRQILQLFGVEPMRVRERRLRSEAYRQRADGLAASSPAT